MIWVINNFFEQFVARGLTPVFKCAKIIQIASLYMTYTDIWFSWRDVVFVRCLCIATLEFRNAKQAKRTQLTIEHKYSKNISSQPQDTFTRLSCRKKYNLLEAFLIILSTWLFHFRSLLNVKPKILASAWDRIRFGVVDCYLATLA